MNVKSVFVLFLLTSLAFWPTNAWTTNDPIVMSNDDGPCSLDAPLYFAATNVDASEAELAWSTVNGATGYRLRVVETATSTLVYDMVMTTNQVVVDGLNPSTAYTAYVNPTCPNGESPNAAITTFTTLDFLILGEVVVNLQVPGCTRVDVSPTSLNGNDRTYSINSPTRKASYWIRFNKDNSTQFVEYFARIDGTLTPPMNCIITDFDIDGIGNVEGFNQEGEDNSSGFFTRMKAIRTDTKTHVAEEFGRVRNRWTTVNNQQQITIEANPPAGFSVAFVKKCNGSGLGKFETPELQSDVEERSKPNHLTNLDDIIITPNPFTNDLQFRDKNGGDYAGQFSCQVFNLNGQLMHEAILTPADSKVIS
ncbi:MAG: fibronectin type III domain-containing protein, partial [Saprospiraceae bacterium]|nr:fibronectin type III domain-containing protein [Saprospiraceae bacterium]